MRAPKELSGAVCLLGLALSVALAAAPVGGSLALPVAPPLPDLPWTGSWALDHIYPLNVSVAVPATLEHEGAPLDDGSAPWSYRVVAAPNGPFYECDYFPQEHEDNIGEGHINLLDSGVSIRGSCHLLVFGPDSIFAGHAFAWFRTDGYCSGGTEDIVSALVPCEEAFQGAIVATFEFGMFRVPGAPVPAIPASAAMATGDWLWEMLLPEDKIELTPDTSLLVIDHQDLDWKLNSGRGDLYCFDGRVWFLPTSQVWSPLVGYCTAVYQPKGTQVWAHAAARFQVLGSGGPLDLVATSLGGCGRFLVTGEGEPVDVPHWRDMLLPEVSQGPDGGSVDWPLTGLLTQLIQYHLDPLTCGGP